MKAKFLHIAFTLLLTLLLFNGMAQNVGINDDGSAPDNSAMLDVSASNKGLLIPRVALTGASDATTIASPATSLLIYNTTDGSGLVPGYYYNAGTSAASVWTKLLIPTNMTLSNVLEQSNDAGGEQVKNLADPTGDQDAATKAWVEDKIDETINEMYVAGHVLMEDNEGNLYKTVVIGDQIWMAENLAYLPSASPSSSGSNTDPYYYVYGYTGNDVSEAKATENYQIYGVLYNWPAALNACPAGWHLPTDAEWTTLVNYLGGESVAGGKLKETGTAHWVTPNTGATNESGFTALPGGSRLDSGHFDSVGGYGNWWSATGYGSSNAWHRYLFCNNSDVYRYGLNREYGFSVRCVRDN
jgi:uncharacterized protein (TIGR02145 family)